MKRNITSGICISFFLFLMISCDGKNICENSANIEVEKVLLEMADGNYCSLLKQSINRDVKSIKEFCRLTSDEKTGFYHGEVLVKLIDKLGEDFFIESISDFNRDDKYKLSQYIYIGFFQEGRYKLKTRNTKDVFPKVYDFLNEKNH